MERNEISLALRQIARGFDALADAVADNAAPADQRELAVLRAWSDRGLIRAEAGRQRWLRPACPLECLRAAGIDQGELLAAGAVFDLSNARGA